METMMSNGGGLVAPSQFQECPSEHGPFELRPGVGCQMLVDWLQLAQGMLRLPAEEVELGQRIQDSVAPPQIIMLLGQGECISE
jgi:hypothetical protein